MAAVLAFASQDGAAQAAGAQVRVQLTPVRSTVLSAEIPGRLAELPVRDGESFRAGQALARLDCTLHEARLAKAAALALEARKTHEAHARLDEFGSISTLEIEISAAREAGAEADLALARALVARCGIAAPYPGRVVEVLVRQHQFVTEGQPLLEILDDRELEVDMVVPSRWLAWLRPGHRYVVRLDETGSTYPAEVRRVGARIDAVGQSVKVYGVIVGDHPGLTAGMSGTAELDPP